MTQFRKLTLLFILFSASIFSCQQVVSQNKMSPQDFSKKINATPNAQVIDVRTPQEYTSGHIPNAVNMDWNGGNFDKSIETLDKTKPVFVYCLSGGRSASAAEALRSDGFKEVYELKGGIMKWQAENLPETNSSSSIGINDEDYKNILNTDKMVLVDFYAPWCKPCKEMAPYMEEIAKGHTDKIILSRINADDNKYITKKLKVEELPTLFLYKNNVLVWQHTGFISKEDLLKKLNL